MLVPRRLAEGVELVDEDDAGGLGLGLLEHVADAGRADADEHLDEVGAGEAEERHARLAGDGLGQQRLAGARRADEQHALGNAAAERLVLVGRAEEIDDFADFFDRFVDAGDVVERDAEVFLGVHLAAAAAERHRRAGAAEAAHHQEDDEHEQGRDDDHRQVVAPHAGSFGVIEIDLHVFERGLQLLFALVAFAFVGEERDAGGFFVAIEDLALDAADDAVFFDDNVLELGELDLFLVAGVRRR